MTIELAKYQSMEFGPHITQEMINANIHYFNATSISVMEQLAKHLELEGEYAQRVVGLIQKCFERDGLQPDLQIIRDKPDIYLFEPLKRIFPSLIVSERLFDSPLITQSEQYGFRGYNPSKVLAANYINQNLKNRQIFETFTPAILEEFNDDDVIRDLWLASLVFNSWSYDEETTTPAMFREWRESPQNDSGEINPSKRYYTLHDKNRFNLTFSQRIDILLSSNYPKPSWME